MSDDIYITARDNGGQHPRLHTDPDCRALSYTDAVRKPRSAYPEDAPVCKYCRGDAATTAEQDPAPLRALKNAAEGSQ